MARRTLLLIASLLVAAAGTALVWVYVASADARAQEQWRPVKVWRATRTLDPGTAGTAIATAAEVVSVPANLVPDKPVLDLSTLANRTVRTRILTGQLIVDGQFADLTPDVPDGSLAVEVTMADPNRAADLLRPGSKVALYWLPGSGGDADKTGKVVKLLIPDVTVLVVAGRVNGGFGSGTARSTQASLVSLKLDKTTAPRVILASQTGTLYFAVKGKGADSSAPAQVSLDDLSSPFSVNG